MLEDLDDPRRAGRRRFADQEVHVLRHDYVADQREGISGTNLTENTDDEVASADRMEKRSALVATEGDEVEVVAAGDASEILQHVEKRRSPPFENRKG